MTTLIHRKSREKRGGLIRLQTGLTLSLSLENNITDLGWPWPSTSFSLEQTPNLNTTFWTVVAHIPILNHSRKHVDLGRTNQNHSI